PFKKSLELFYQKDEWAHIDEALTKADLRLQKQVEEARLETEKTTTILEAINDAIIAVDRYDSILFYNSKFQKNFFVKTEGKEIQKKAWHIFKDDALEAFHKVLKTGEVVSLKAMSFPQNPGRFFDLTITPLTSASHGINGALGVFHDVTDF